MDDRDASKSEKIEGKSDAIVVDEDTTWICRNYRSTWRSP